MPTLAVMPDTPTTINVAIAHAVTPPIAFMRTLLVGENVPAIQPPTAAAKMPDTAHQAKPIQAGNAPEDCALETSKLTSPKPKPIMVRITCTTSDAMTPAATADHVQLAAAAVVRVARAIGISRRNQV